PSLFFFIIIFKFLLRKIEIFRTNKKIITLFKSSKKEDLISLEDVALSMESSHLNDSVWVKYSDLVNRYPLFKEVAEKQLLKTGHFLQKEDSLSLYLVLVKEVLRRNQVAPKSYITPTIKQMILHQRKKRLLRTIEETLVDDAQKNKQFEIY
ncbi:MAG: peptidyl-prolyl cis-trans isomerase, partial [Lutibacter sp.]|nr:peptidyl-prolyl cis-trans isomerase [Lutibacter sp.]